MPREIYNEGRVVGLSAYELYIRHQLSEYPELEPVTEREWLSSTLGNGCSLILRIPKDTPAGVFERQLPDNSTLCAASSITASVFDGQVKLDESKYWATQIVSYGPLISNTQASHPTTPGETKQEVPVGIEWTESQLSHIKEYMKIVDGLVYQPGTWTKNEKSSEPYMDFATPDLHKRGTVRLKLSKKLEQDVYVILTGWIHRPIIAGSTKLEAGALNLIHPGNGDFLGAERFPWAVKITFTVPTSVMHVLNDRAYARQLPKGQATKSITARPIVDLDSTDIQAFYNINDTTSYSGPVGDSKVAMNVSELNVTGDGASVLAVHQRSDKTHLGLSGLNYPPVVYGAKVTSKGDKELVPVDTAAPGTVKIFDNRAKATAYPKVIPNTYAFYHDKTNKNLYLIEGDDVISLDTKLETKDLGTSTNPKFTSIVKSGDKEVRALSLVDPNNNMLDTSGSRGLPIPVYEEHGANDRNLNWDDLITALDSNRSIDVIGSELHRFRKELPNVTSGDSGVLDIRGAGYSNIAGHLSVRKTFTCWHECTVQKHLNVMNGALINKGESEFNMSTHDTEFSFNKPIKSGADYIVFKNGLRLYISSTAPDPKDVPIGSIGIGW